MIDGTGRAPVTDAAIVIREGRFLEVGKRGEVTIPAGAEVIEAGGRTILPGLIDGHCHYYEDWVRELYLPFGVTTCPDVHVDGPAQMQWALDQRDKIQKGTLRGPRLWLTGRRVNGPPPGGRPGPAGQMIVRTPEEARKAVREEVEEGVDGLKFFEFLTPELAQAAAEEAHRLGRPVFGHSLDIFAAAAAGYQSVEHFWPVVYTSVQDPARKAKLGRVRGGDPGSPESAYVYLDPEFYRYVEPEMFDRIIRVMVDKNVHESATWATWFRLLSPRAAVMKQQELALLKDPRFAIPPKYAKRVEEIFAVYEKFTPQKRAQLLEGYRKLEDFARRFVAAGGKLHAGSDPNHAIPALALHQEIELLVEAGLSPAQAIQAASLNVAQAWRKEKDYGSVAKGKVADLAIVRGDLRKDISALQNLENVEMVFLDGKIVGGSKYKKP